MKNLISSEDENSETENTILSLDKVVASRKKPDLATLNDATKSITSEPLTIEEQREHTRTWLATRLFNILTISLIGTGVYIFVDSLVPQQISQERSNMHREIITLIWTSQVTLMGSALGFYFGSERNGSSNSKKTDADV